MDVSTNHNIGLPVFDKCFHGSAPDMASASDDVQFRSVRGRVGHEDLVPAIRDLLPSLFCKIEDRILTELEGGMQRREWAPGDTEEPNVSNAHSPTADAHSVFFIPGFNLAGVHIACDGKNARHKRTKFVDSAGGLHAAAMRCQVACNDKNFNGRLCTGDFLREFVGTMYVRECKYAHSFATSGKKRSGQSRRSGVLLLCSLEYDEDESYIGRMIAYIRSLWIWGAVTLLILFWLPLLAIIRLFDRDPALYTTGRWFRRLGSAMTRVNPVWKISIKGLPERYVRKPVVVVSNHQSLADIPVISRLPWEMKWVGKRELFRLPIIGWMMRLAGDIPLERGDARSGARVLGAAARYLKKNCPVIIFPEGTRSPDGLVSRFTDGAFHLAIASQVPVLPVAIEGTRNALPKKNWRFGATINISVTVLPEVPTTGLTRKDVETLRDRTRAMICESIASSRNVPPASVDAVLQRGGQKSG